MGYNAIFEGKRAVLANGLWQEQKDITFLAASGTLPTDALNENSSSNSQGIATAICSGCISPGKGRKVIEGAEGYQVREGSARYGALFGAEKDDIGLENTYSWEINTE